VATLFEIMSGLIVGAFTSEPMPLEEQRAFFRAHIQPWASTCFGDLAAAEASAFYMTVGQLGQLFLQMEEEAFEMVREHA
jgi:TorA maturation chaperone TorD